MYKDYWNVIESVVVGSV